MNTSSKSHGLFSWSELMTTDFESSLTFYKDLFGWILREVPGRGDTKYALILTENVEEPFAGIISMPQKNLDRGMPSCWQTYVTVDNVEETVIKAQNLGAIVVLSPMQIERVGVVAAIKDPQGAIISIIKYTN